MVVLEHLQSVVKKKTECISIIMASVLPEFSCTEKSS